MNQFKKVAFYTLGCKLNFSETSTIARLFEDAGFAKVEFEETPDLYVINTCSVTENADKKCKQLVKRAQKINPESFIVIVGCYAQLKPEEIAKIPGVDMVLGANEKFNILEHLENKDSKLEKAEVSFDNIKNTKDFVPSYSFGDRTRSFLKVQDGCDYFCTFCTIPLARGKSRNTSVAETVLDNMNGSGSQVIKKIEQAPLFKPEDNVQWSHGAPNQSDFFQSRVNPGMRNNNVKPFATENVGPGLNQGYSTT
ncbi:MAG: hypothetical protein EBU01_11030, partial [Crocinitomicaceae bacterium]|nr:hypothetical protein [Crocinitomicaceae bacterium]